MTITLYTFPRLSGKSYYQQLFLEQYKKEHPEKTVYQTHSDGSYSIHKDGVVTKVENKDDNYN